MMGFWLWALQKAGFLRLVVWTIAGTLGVQAFFGTMERFPNASLGDIEARIDLIRRASIEDLRSPRFVGHLMLAVGMNDDVPEEAPRFCLEHAGGLKVYQYPNQFSQYLVLLSRHRIRSYLEIGCRWGGTFVLTTEYLKRFGAVRKSVAVDIHRSPVKDYYMSFNPRAEFMQVDSKKKRFWEYLRRHRFDLIFIDGDHGYHGVRNDFMAAQNSTDMFVFHDISSVACPSVTKFWEEFKLRARGAFTFHEFTDQYSEVFSRTGGTFMGIGVAIRRRGCRFHELCYPTLLRDSKGYMWRRLLQ